MGVSKWRGARGALVLPSGAAGKSANLTQRRGSGLTPTPVILHDLLRLGERGRGVGRRPQDPGEGAPLQQLTPLAATSGDFVFSRADRLLGAAARFDGHEVA